MVPQLEISSTALRKINELCYHFENGSNYPDDCYTDDNEPKEFTTIDHYIEFIENVIWFFEDVTDQDGVLYHKETQRELRQCKYLLKIIKEGK